MKVFKFGGTSVNSVERIKNVGHILKFWSNEKIMVIVSAMGKTTNALEKVVDAFFAGKKEEALQLFEQVKKQHLTTAKYLLVTHYLPCEAQLKNFFTEAEWLLHDKPVRDYDYYYDQVDSVGELLSTSIVSAYLNEAGITNTWIDVRDIFRTDDEVMERAYYGAQVIHPKTIKPLQNKNILLIVKSFLDPSLPGTIIHNKPVHQLPPIIVLKEKQVILEMSSRDFSFIEKQHVGHF